MKKQTKPLPPGSYLYRRGRGKEQIIKEWRDSRCRCSEDFARHISSLVVHEPRAGCDWRGGHVGGWEQERGLGGPGAQVPI